MILVASVVVQDHPVHLRFPDLLVIFYIAFRQILRYVRHGCATPACTIPAFEAWVIVYAMARVVSMASLATASSPLYRLP
jgi:hypothetical protein